ncbi:MAG TPA: DUF3090 family protein [Chloroflexota bacterium]|nr:DUF3090 family protein [Chloroflexota bacterium]
MENHRLDLGLVSRLTVESFGEPGERTFRMLAEVADGSVSFWLEKQQIVMLGAAMEELLERVGPSRGREPPQTGTTFAGELEVRAGTLALGYDAAADGFRFEASDFLTTLPVSTIVWLASREQIESSVAQIEVIAAASRPRCVLCGTPLSGEPHFCPESNGHAHHDSE